MKTRSTPPLTAAQREAFEARFAHRLSARLEEGAQAVPHDIAERLRVAREQALRAAREARLAVAGVAASPVASAGTVTVGVAGLSGAGPAGGQITTPIGTGMPSVGGLSGDWHAGRQARSPGRGRRLDDSPTSWGWRLAAMLPAIALVAGLWGIQRYARQEQAEATSDIDMQLLSDDLPPAAYADPGFEEFLNRDAGPAVRPIEDAPPDIDGDLVTTETQADLGESETEPAAQAE